MTQHRLSWILFLVIGGIMGYLRYSDFLSHSQMTLLSQFGPIIIIAFHVIIVLKAFGDSVFQGMLCMLVPCYSFYYLLVVSDDFYMRAIFAGLLVGIAQDSALVFEKHIGKAVATVSTWIHSG